MNRHDVMHGHVDTWLLLRDSIMVLEVNIKRSLCSNNEERNQQTNTIPTSGEISLFIIAFL